MKTKFPLLVAAFVALTSLAACGGGGEADAPPLNLVYAGNPASLTKIDTTVGTGAEAVTGKYVGVNYSGWLYNEAAADKKGTQFDAGSYKLKLGAGGVIAGFDQGITGMKVGGKRTVLIPSSLGYGANGRPPQIPPNAGLVFEIEAVQVSDTPI